MAKSYLDQLGEWAKQREESSQRDKNMIAFIAVRDDVKLAVEAGYSVKTIWTNMHEAGRIQFGYDTFIKYVNRLLLKQNKNKTTTEVEPTAEKNNATKNSKPESKKRVTEIIEPIPMPGFTYNSIPNTEELF